MDCMVQYNPVSLLPNAGTIYV